MCFITKTRFVKPSLSVYTYTTTTFQWHLLTSLIASYISQTSYGILPPVAYWTALVQFISETRYVVIWVCLSNCYSYSSRKIHWISLNDLLTRPTSYFNYIKNSYTCTAQSRSFDCAWKAASYNFLTHDFPASPITSRSAKS